MHWSERGHRVAGEALANYLARLSRRRYETHQPRPDELLPLRDAVL